MEAIDNLSSKIVGGFDYFIHSYLILFFVVIVIVGIVMYLGNISSSNDLSNSPFSDTTSGSSTGITILQIIVVVIIVIILLWLLTHVIKRLFGINIIQTIKNIFSNQRFNNVVDSIDDKIEDMEYSLLNYLDKPKHDSDSDDEDNINVHSIITSSTTGVVGGTGSSSLGDDSHDTSSHDSSTHKHGEEVFNVSNNKYTYKDAKSICKAYNARLATYSEVENSYNAGGEWCNYGWSENQLALFPTQQNTYDKLQKIKGHENDCGRPGVNGGFLDESLKFGVNCYGVKPDMDEKEKELMKLERIYPKTKSEVELEKEVNYWKEHLDDINVAPFNHDKWNRI